MKLKNCLLLLPVTAIILTSCGGGVTSTKATLKTKKDTVDYYLGQLVSANFTNTEAFNNPNLQAFIAGINYGIKELDPREDMAEFRKMDEFIRMYMMEYGAQLAEKNLVKAEEFLAKNKSKAGVIELEEGKLQYKVITEGTGEKPIDGDNVRVIYKGTFIDGTEFDSTEKNGGEPATFIINHVIPGWTMALKSMSVGSKWMLYIHPELAYGPDGNQPQGGPIGPNETLIFEVELLEIVK